MNLDHRNQKIIDAIIERAESVCPGSLALIGIYGSFLTGDVHEQSDLDLLILINDERGWQLGCTFIQDDIQVGHDLYCTSWDSLRKDAQYPHPHIAKLMDSKIVYCADERYRTELEALRSQARAVLASPLTMTDYKKAERDLRQAESCCMDALLSDNRSDVLSGAGGMLYYIENAVALLNKRYFRLGVRRIYDELNEMKLRPANLCQRIEAVVSADSIESVRQNALLLIKETRACFHEVRGALAAEKHAPTPDALRGTYEEMFSNWRNKMHLAAKEDSRHLSFMSLVSLNAMMSDIREDTDIGSIDVMSCFDSKALQKTADSFDDLLRQYLHLYKNVSLTEARYPDIEAFLREYKG